MPDAAAEVWSPSNIPRAIAAKREEYHAAGLPVLVEARIQSGHVHLDWSTRTAGGWRLRASAVGEVPLEVSGDRPFRVVPDALLRPERR